MSLLIGIIAEVILFWVILSPETNKEIAIFAVVSYLSISLDLNINMLKKATMNLGLNLLLDSMKPYDSIISCVSGIALWKFIAPETLLGVALFLVLWIGGQLVIGILWLSNNK